MNTNKYIASLIVKNHNNSDKFNKEEAEMRNKIYGRISAIINNAKIDNISISQDTNKFLVGTDDGKDFNPKHGVTIFKGSKYSEELADFFFGLKRTNNAIKYLSWYGYTHVRTKLEVKEYNNSTSVNVIPAYQ